MYFRYNDTVIGSKKMSGVANHARKVVNKDMQTISPGCVGAYLSNFDSQEVELHEKFS